MKKMLIILMIMVMTFTTVSCSSQQVQSQPEQETVEDVVVGKVIDVVGNLITIQLANGDLMENMTGKFPNGQMGEGETFSRPEGITGERPEGMTGNKFANGEKPEGMAGGNFGNGERPEGMTGDKFASGERPQGMAGGLMGNMFGAMQNIELTDETVDYTIPVSAKVYSMGEQSTILEIEEESFVSIMLNENGVIISVNLLG